jgi:hypothetical protein
MAETTYKIDVRKEVAERLTVHTNVTLEVVVTTVDKVRLCLMRNREHLAAKMAWAVPLGILLTLIATLVAADFRDVFGVKKESWWAVFFLAAVVALVWFAFSAGNAIKFIWRDWRKGSFDSIDHIINELKAQTGPIDIRPASEPEAARAPPFLTG